MRMRCCFLDHRIDANKKGLDYRLTNVKSHNLYQIPQCSKNLLTR
jgi:hypothetical protein